MPENEVKTMQDLAARIGVSRATVGAVLNGKAQERGIPETTQRRVLQAAQEFNFRPDPAASALRGGRAYLLGVLWNLSTSPVAGIEAYEIVEMARRQGFAAMLGGSSADSVSVTERLSDFIDRRVDSVILHAYTELLENRGVIDLLKRFTSAVVVSDEPFELPANCDLVVYDRSAAFEEAANYLLQTGRRRIAFFGRVINNRSKVHGIFRALGSHGRDSDDLEVVDLEPTTGSSGFTREKAHNALQAVLGKRPTQRIDAIVCANDILAAHAMSWLRATGFNIPRDIAVVGAANLEWAESLDPPLASIDRCQNELIQAVESLMLSRASSSGNTQRQILVPMRYVWRASAGPMALPSPISGGWS